VKGTTDGTDFTDRIEGNEANKVPGPEPFFPLFSSLESCCAAAGRGSCLGHERFASAWPVLSLPLDAVERLHWLAPASERGCRKSSGRLGGRSGHPEDLCRVKTRIPQSGRTRSEPMIRPGRREPSLRLANPGRLSIPGHPFRAFNSWPNPRVGGRELKAVSTLRLGP
jgi:hypothetical protein